jgi:ABC-type lipoprotein release transport system permease subunit
VLVVIVVLAVWIFSLLSGLLSARRIRAIDPASAAGAR